MKKAKLTVVTITSLVLIIAAFISLNASKKKEYNFKDKILKVEKELEKGKIGKAYSKEGKPLYRFLIVEGVGKGAAAKRAALDNAYANLVEASENPEIEAPYIVSGKEGTKIKFQKKFFVKVTDQKAKVMMFTIIA